MKIYLITGGAGFIGSNFIHYLFKKYKNDVFIINYDKLTYAGSLNNLKEVQNNSNYKFIKGDICDIELLTEVFLKYNIQYVVNFAAESHVDRSIKDPSVFIRTNVLGTQTLLEVAKNYWETENGFREGKRFLQVSTDEVYGSLGECGYFTENTALDPHSPYSASKASADLIVKSYCDTYKMPVNITRCSNNYGPYQFPEKLIPLVINNCLYGRELPIYGDGTNIRDWIYVKDHCKAIDMVLDNGTLGEVYNIGGNNEKQNIELVKIIIKTLNDILPENDIRKKHINYRLIKHVKDRKGHDRRYAIDYSRIQRELEWMPNLTFKDGIFKTVKWYLDNEQWFIEVLSEEYKNYYEETYENKEN